jgi:hypothetical protein
MGSHALRASAKGLFMRNLSPNITSGDRFRMKDLYSMLVAALHALSWRLIVVRL